MRVFKGMIIFILMILFTVIYFNVSAIHCAEIAPTLLGSFMVLLAYLAYIFYGFPKFKPTPIQVTLIRGLIAMMIVYFAAVYIFGAFAGYERIIYNTKTIIPAITTAITIIATEIVRYIMINGNRDTGIFPWLVTIGIIAIETVTVLDVNTLVSTESVLVYLVTIFTPLVLRNLLLTVYSHHVSFRLALAYALIMVEYKLVMPVVPNLDDFIYCYADVIISFLALIMAYRVISKNYEGYSMITLKDGFSVLDTLLFIVFFSLGTLISGVTPLQIYVATANSNTTPITKGDGPIVLKGVKEDGLEEGSKILYKEEDGTKKLYSVSEIKVIKKTNEKEVDRIEIYVLNDKKESVLIDNKRIYAKVLMNMKYVFVPTIYINNYINGGIK